MNHPWTCECGWRAGDSLMSWWKAGVQAQVMLFFCAFWLIVHTQSVLGYWKQPKDVQKVLTWKQRKLSFSLWCQRVVCYLLCSQEVILADVAKVVLMLPCEQDFLQVCTEMCSYFSTFIEEQRNGGQCYIIQQTQVQTQFVWQSQK